MITPCLKLLVILKINEIPGRKESQFPRPSVSLMFIIFALAA